MAKELIYYKRNVPYTVIVRRNAIDTQGVSLNTLTPWLALEADDLRDFKIANKKLIIEGIIVPTATPDVDWETPNALTDEDITELLKNYMKLKSTLEEIDSVSTLSRMLEASKSQEKSDKIKKLIRARLAEISDDEVLSPAEMQGATN